MVPQCLVLLIEVFAQWVVSHGVKVPISLAFTQRCSGLIAVLNCGTRIVPSFTDKYLLYPVKFLHSQTTLPDDDGTNLRTIVDNN